MPIKTADLCDAHDEVQACNIQFRAWGRRHAFSGRIRTVRCYEDFGLFKQLLTEPGAGSVLVVDGGGSLARALCGDTMAALAVKNGWAGIVVHGAVRDVDEIDTMEIGVRALGSASRRGERKGDGEIDVPVAFGGVTFVPGRALVADHDGVVVLPEGVSEDEMRALLHGRSDSAYT